MYIYNKFANMSIIITRSSVVELFKLISCSTNLKPVLFLIQRYLFIEACDLYPRVHRVRDVIHILSFISISVNIRHN